MAIKINGATVIDDSQNGTLTGTLSATGNITGGNVVTSGIISATGNISTGGTITAATIVANVTPPAGGAVSTTGNVTGGNVLTGGIVSATGNITGNYVLGNGSQLTGIDATSIQNGTSNVKVVSSGGNATISIGGTSNVAVFATTGEYVTGVVSVTGSVTGGNILTAGLISATGNITGGNIATTGLATIAGFTISGNTIVSSGATMTLDPNGPGGTNGLVVIQGNLQVEGTTTTINSNTVSTNDLVISVGNNAPNASAANGGGLDVGPIGAPFITWLYNNTANSWVSSAGISAVGNVTAGGNISLVGNIVDTGPLTVITSSNGNITLSPDGSGVVIVSKDIRNGQANGTGNIGASGATFNTVFAKATTAQYADLAENYLGDAAYAPGIVVDFGGEQEVTLSTGDSSRRVAGVVSTNPAHLMNSALDGAHVIAVALVGRVPTQVTGTVAKGDLMVSAGNGRARAEANPATGTVIGKSLENFNGGEGTIEIVICMQ